MMQTRGNQHCRAWTKGEASISKLHRVVGEVASRGLFGVLRAARRLLECICLGVVAVVSMMLEAKTDSCACVTVGPCGRVVEIAATGTRPQSIICPGSCMGRGAL
jgi:hypothetical protein